MAKSKTKKEYRIELVNLGNRPPVIISATSPKEALKMYLDSIDIFKGQFHIMSEKWDSRYHARVIEVKTVTYGNLTTYETVNFHIYSLVSKFFA